MKTITILLTLQITRKTKRLHYNIHYTYFVRSKVSCVAGDTGRQRFTILPSHHPHVRCIPHKAPAVTGTKIYYQNVTLRLQLFVVSACNKMRWASSGPSPPPTSRGSQHPQKDVHRESLSARTLCSRQHARRKT